MARPGRKPGIPKTGGRQKGTPNKSRKELRDIIDAELQPNELVRVLAGIVRNTASPEPARISAVKELWDRRYGKAPQAITGANGGPLAIVGALGTMTDEQVQELIAQLGGDAGGE